MRIALVVAIMLLLCGVGVCADSQQPPAPIPQAKQTNQQTTNKKQEINLPANETIKKPTPEIDQKKPDEFKTDKNDKTFPDLLIVWFTGALAIFAFCQVVAMILQYRVMRIQASSLRDTVEATQKAAEAAELNARAAIGIELPIIRAIATELLSTDTLITGEGPYCGGVDNGPPTKYSAVGYIRFENHGRTPAFPEKISVGWMVAEKLPENPTYLKTSNLSHAAVIKPDGDFAADTHYGIELTDKELIATKEDKAWLWFYGCIYYHDFLNSKRGASFCWRFANRDFDSVSYYFSSDGEPPKQYTQSI